MINRPTIYEYEETVRKVYGISEDAEESERGRTFMADLKTKRQGVVNFDQIISFGNKVRTKIARRIHQLQTKHRTGTYDSILRKSPPR